MEYIRKDEALKAIVSVYGDVDVAGHPLSAAYERVDGLRTFDIPIREDGLRAFQKIKRAINMMEEHHVSGPFKVTVSKDIFEELAEYCNSYCAFDFKKGNNLTIFGCRLQIVPGLPYSFAVTKDIELDLDSDEGYMWQD